MRRIGRVNYLEMRNPRSVIKGNKLWYYFVFTLCFHTLSQRSGNLLSMEVSGDGLLFKTSCQFLQDVLIFIQRIYFFFKTQIKQSYDFRKSMLLLPD